MANNRLWLVHRPTGEAVCLGKRMGVGWYTSDVGKSVADFFSRTEDAGDPADQDDFILAIEDGSGAPCCCADWTYDENHKPKLNLPGGG